MRKVPGTVGYFGAYIEDIQRSLIALCLQLQALSVINHLKPMTLHQRGSVLAQHLISRQPPRRR